MFGCFEKRRGFCKTCVFDKDSDISGIVVACIYVTFVITPRKREILPVRGKEHSYFDIILNIRSEIAAKLKLMQTKKNPSGNSLVFIFFFVIRKYKSGDVLI